MTGHGPVTNVTTNVGSGSVAAILLTSDPSISAIASGHKTAANKAQAAGRDYSVSVTILLTS